MAGVASARGRNETMLRKYVTEFELKDRHLVELQTGQVLRYS